MCVEQATQNPCLTYCMNKNPLDLSAVYGFYLEGSCTKHITKPDNMEAELLCPSREGRQLLFHQPVYECAGPGMQFEMLVLSAE